MKYCSKCGAELLDEAVMCPHCGAQVEMESKTDKKGAKYGQPKNTMALVGFIFSFFIPLVGLILGIMGLVKAKDYNDDKKGLAIAAIIISVAMMIFNFIYLSKIQISTNCLILG